MRSTVIAAAILLLVSSTLTAQEGFRAGLKGGPQSTWMFNADEGDNAEWLYQHTLRAMFGGTFGYNFSDGVGIQLDLLYSKQGQRFEYFDIEYFRKVDYFKVPVLLNLNTSPEGTAFAYLNVGPQFSFLTKAVSGDVDFGIFNLPGFSGVDISDTYSSVNIGAVLAFGAGFNLTDFLQLTTGIRLDFDFTDVEDDKLSDVHLGVGGLNRQTTHNATGAFEIGLRYVLRTGE